jgi:hypothetical protein
MNDTLVLEAGGIDSGRCRVGNYGSIAAFGDPQAMDGGAGCLGELAINFVRGSIGSNLHFLGKIPDGFS